MKSINHKKMNASYFKIFYLVFLQMITASAVNSTYAQDTTPEIKFSNYTISPTIADPVVDTFDINFSLEKKNITGRPNVRVDFYLSKDSIITNADQWLGIRFYDLVDSISNIELQMRVSSFMPPGDYYYILSLNQANNGNGLAIAPVSIIKTLPDLSIVLSANSSIDLYPGSPGQIGYNFKKLGFANNDSLRVSYLLSADSLYDVSDILLKNEGITGNFYYDNFASVYTNFTVPPATLFGDYFLLVVADPDNLVQERNELNNVASFKARVLQPSVNLSQVDFLTNYTINDSTLRFTYTEVKTGSSQNLFATTAFYLSEDPFLNKDEDLYIGQSSYTWEDEDASRQVNFSYKVPSFLEEGRYFVFLSLDNSNVVPETNETDNIFARAENIAFSSNIDLIVSPDTNIIVVHQSNVDLSTLVINQGSENAGSSDVGIYLYNSQNELLLQSGTYGNALGAGDSAVIGFNINLPYEGVFYIRYEVDPIHEVLENNEENNSGYQKLVYYTITSTNDNSEAKILIGQLSNEKEFTIFQTNEKGIQYSLVNQVGQVVWVANDHTSDELKVNCNGFGSGIYLLRAEKNGNVLQKKIVIY